MRAIILDLDDTLINDRRASRIAFAALVHANRARLLPSSESARLANWRAITNRHWQRYEQGEITFVEQRLGRFGEFLGPKFSAAEIEEAVQLYLTSYESSWQLFPSVAEFFARTVDLPKVIVTNGQREQQTRKVEVTGLYKHVIGVVTPEDCGFWKPNAAIFLAAARILKAEPTSCLMIGDDLTRDIEPARRLGMKVHHVSHEGRSNGLLSAIEAAA